MFKSPPAGPKAATVSYTVIRALPILDFPIVVIDLVLSGDKRRRDWHGGAPFAAATAPEGHSVRWGRGNYFADRT